MSIVKSKKSYDPIGTNPYHNYINLVISRSTTCTCYLAIDTTHRHSYSIEL